MPIDVSALKALAAAGATVEMIIAAVEAQQVAERQRALEDEKLKREAKRPGARERKRLQRLRDQSDSSSCVGNLRTPEPVTRDLLADVTVVTRDTPPPPFPLLSSPTPPSNNPLTPCDDVDARERDGPGSDLAERLAVQVMEILGIDSTNVPRLWRGLPEYLARGIAGHGWRADPILAAARHVATAFARRTGERHPESCGYLTKPIEVEHSKLERELALKTPIATDPAALERARAATTWVSADDIRFKAWDAHLRNMRGRGLPTDARGGWHIEMDWPPGHPNSEAA
jgi:hypothetical protein